MNTELTSITIQNSKISLAFVLITFMVGEMIFDETIDAPVKINNYSDLDSRHFHSLRSKMMLELISKKEARLNIKESLLLYLIVDMVCKCFVGDNNPLLKKHAIKMMKIDDKEYQQVRKSYLHFAESLLDEMNKKFEGNPKFEAIHEKLLHWKV